MQLNGVRCSREDHSYIFDLRLNNLDSISAVLEIVEFASLMANPSDLILELSL